MGITKAQLLAVLTTLPDDCLIIGGTGADRGSIGITRKSHHFGYVDVATGRLEEMPGARNPRPRKKAKKGETSGKA